MTEDYESAVEEYRDRIEKLLAISGADKGRCRACGKEIWWLKTKSGKAMPWTRDGVSHFADCPQANQFRRPR